MSNLTRLTLLDLGDNYFHGQIPTLTAAGLEVLVLAENLFDGEIPYSIGNLTGLSKLYLHGNQLTGPILDLTDLTLLHTLDLSENRLTGPIPLSIGNLLQLRDLDLSSNYRITGLIPPSLTKNLEQLVGLNLGFNQLTGTIPQSIDNLKNLRLLYLGSNKLTGPIPSQLGNLTLLENLFLFSNRLSGPFPVIDIARLTKLTTLNLASNKLNGQLRFDFFLHNFPNLTNLDLSFNELSVVFDEHKTNITSLHDQYNKFTDLRLGSCNLSELPHVLESPDWELTTLDLSYNSLSGQIPTWFLSVSSTSLSTLNLSGNSLTGFSQDPVFFNWTSLNFLDLSSNELQGSLPVPPPSIKTYIASNNSLSGEIPPSLCNLTDIRRLDLANNNFGGVIPQCLAILTSKLLSVLILRGNHLSGPIPDHLSNNNRACSLRMIDVSDNQLQGPLPRSLSSCTELRFLNLRSNGIVDTFPSWLGSLSNLRVLILSSNRFHGAIAEPEDGYLFPKLQVIDISRNNFGGFLPSKYFQSWNNVTSDIFDEDGEEYIGEITIQSSGTFLQYDYSMTIINKGMEMEYGKILNYFIAIDLSGNNFTGEIPASVGRVKGLRLLNLSNNVLTGHIPAFLKDLTHLEALDLSRNDLSGDIPQQLAQLSYLSYFNVSYNRLSGRIPRGKQFNTFQNDSYIRNLGLCGEPLSEECGARTTPPYNEAEGSYFELEWPMIVMGVVSGLVVGVAMGLVVPIRRENWFVWKISEFVRVRLAR